MYLLVVNAIVLLRDKFFISFFFFFFYQTDLHEICRIASPLAADNDAKLLFRSLEGRCQGNKFCGQNRPPSLTL